MDTVSRSMKRLTKFSKKDALPQACEESMAKYPDLPKYAPVAAHLRGMWPIPTSQKDTLMLKEENSNYNTTNQTRN